MVFPWGHLPFTPYDTDRQSQSEIVSLPARVVNRFRVMRSMQAGTQEESLTPNANNQPPRRQERQEGVNVSENRPSDPEDPRRCGTVLSIHRENLSFLGDLGVLAVQDFRIAASRRGGPTRSARGTASGGRSIRPARAGWCAAPNRPYRIGARPPALRDATGPGGAAGASDSPRD